MGGHLTYIPLGHSLARAGGPPIRRSQHATPQERRRETAPEGVETQDLSGTFPAELPAVMSGETAGFSSSKLGAHPWDQLKRWGFFGGFLWKMWLIRKMTDFWDSTLQYPMGPHRIAVGMGGLPWSQRLQHQGPVPKIQYLFQPLGNLRGLRTWMFHDISLVRPWQFCHKRSPFAGEARNDWPPSMLLAGFGPLQSMIHGALLLDFFNRKARVSVGLFKNGRIQNPLMTIVQILRGSHLETSPSVG